MKAVISVVFVLALLACAYTQAHASDVVVLTSANFDEVIKDNDFVLVEFFAPWCGHCKKLAPEYELAATALKGVAVLATVDCTVEEDLASRFGIQGFPTIKFFKRGGEPIDFTGDRNAKGIQTWVQGKMEPPVVLLASEEEVNKFNERATLGRVVVFSADDDSDLVKMFSEVAESVDTLEFSFGRVSSAEVAEKLKQAMDTIVVFYTHQNPTVYADEKEAQAFKTWLLEKGYPRLETLVLNQAFVNRVTEKKRPMVIAFHENADQLEVVRKIAEATYQDAHVTETPVAAYPELAAQWGASGLKFPTIIVATWEEGHPNFKAFDEEKELTVETAKQFLSECIDGTCVPFKKSQPLPTAEELAAENVRPIVGKNFDEVVLDETKDVIVEFYAPWCGHCKSLAPLYEELATVFKKVESVVIAKIDATQNYIDPKYNIRGFPTLLHFPANNKAEPIVYDGSREFPSFAKWIHEHAATKFDLEAMLPAEPEVEVEVEDLTKDEL